MRNKMRMSVLAAVIVLMLGTTVSYVHTDAKTTKVLNDERLGGNEVLQISKSQAMPEDNSAEYEKERTGIVTSDDGKDIAQTGKTGGDDSFGSAGQDKKTDEPHGKEEVPVDVPGSLIPADAEKGGKQYKFLKNRIFYDFDNLNVKKIVTKVMSDGNFMAEDLGTWLKKQDVYRISVVEDNGEDKKLYYESIPENQARDKYFSAKDGETVYFDWLVSEGEVITATYSCFEEVLLVEEDGSFYTSLYVNDNFSESQ